MRSIPASWIPWKNAAGRTVPLVTGFEIEVNDSTTLYLVQGDPSGTGSITAWGHTYLACAIAREGTEQSIEGDFPAWQLAISNINGVAGGYVEQNDLDGRNVTIRHWLLDDSESITETWSILSAHYNRKQAVLVLGPPNFFKRRSGRWKWQRQRCQHPWAKRFEIQSDCGYPGDEFQPGTGQDFAAGTTTDSEQQRQFGWYTKNATKLSTFASNWLNLGTLYLESDDTDILWVPGYLNAPYFYKKLSGDFDVRTYLKPFETRIGYLAGLLCQGIGSYESSWVFLGRHLDEQEIHGIRGEAAIAGVAEESLSAYPSIPFHVRMVRAGNLFTLSYAGAGQGATDEDPGPDGTWQSIGSFTVPMETQVNLGLCMSCGVSPEVGKNTLSVPWFRFASGGDPECERTLEACLAKGNSHRYFAFPGIPLVG